MPNDWKQGIDKIPAHALGFGIPFGLLAWYSGWGVLPTLTAWRAYEEFLDWRSGRDTLGKALIDLASQLLLTTLAVILRHQNLG